MYKIFVFVFVVCFSLNLDAQQIYTWEDYGLSFSLADDFKETVSTGEELCTM